ncbi:MAG TPA: HNH endonuclease signature motif containing protein [Acidimicrobiales bacterium]|nr:HNH endonuclease signature motif containing protein [Acidimicrobiales bacterium]
MTASTSGCSSTRAQIAQMAPNGTSPTSITGTSHSGIASTGIGYSQSGLQGAVPAPGSCTWAQASDGYALADRSCTPGAVDSAVNQADIGTTICRPGGYTSTVRAPVQFTEAVKPQLMAAYSATGRRSSYELDHLIPLGLGGSNAISNLWPEPNQGSPAQFDPTDPYGINAKDGVEDALHQAVCNGQMSLVDAQMRIVSDWTTALSG